MSTTAAPAPDAEEWISRADAAKIARRSEATIIRDETDHDLDTRRGPNGQKLLRLADLVRIRRIKPADMPAGATGAGTRTCSPRRRSRTGCRSRSAIDPRAPISRWAATGTTPSSSPMRRPCW